MKKIFAAFLTLLLVLLIGTAAFGSTESLLSFINQKIIKCDTDNVTVTAGTITAPGIAQETTLQALDAKVTAADTDNVTVTSSALPTGAATEATLAGLSSKITAVDTDAVSITSPLPAGTNAIGKLAANDGVDIGDVTVNNAAGSSSVPVQGAVAHDYPASANPVLVGFKANSSTSTPTPVSGSDAVYGMADRLGRIVAILDAPANKQVGSSVLRTSTTSPATLRSAPGAGVRTYVKTLIVYNSSATPTEVTLASGSTSITLPAPVGATIIPLDPPFKGEDNTEVTVATIASVSSVRITGMMFFATDG